MEILNRGKAGTAALGVYGAVALLVGALLLAITMGGVFLLLPLAYVTTACILLSRDSFRDLRQLTKLVPIIVIASTLLWQEQYQPSGTSSAASFPLMSGFLVGIEMSVRAVVMVLAISAFVRTVDISELTGLLERLSGSEAFSFVFGLAFNFSQRLERIARDTLNAIKLRGGFRVRNLAVSVRYLLSSTTLKALAKSEDMAYAAEARAFGAGREMPNPLHRDYPNASWLDVAALAGTTGLVILAFALRLALA